MKIIAITGGIGAGKSTILNIFKEFGVKTLDADEVVHTIYNTSQLVMDTVVARWGSEILTEYDGIDRAKIAKIVFKDSREIEWLNNLLHPLVKAEIMGQAKDIKADLFCAIPLLFELGWEHLMDKTIAVWCSEEMQLKRLLQRGWSRQDIASRIGKQLSMDTKIEKADFAIINNDSLNNLRKQCKIVLEKI